MNLGIEILDVAAEFRGAGFQDHFQPDLCQHGSHTVEHCFDVGLGQQGLFDCSGLVIASLCEVGGIPAEDWNPGYRHAQQMAELAENRAPQHGDVVVFYKHNAIHGQDPAPKHVALYVSTDCYLDVGNLGAVDFRSPPATREFPHLRPINPGMLLAAGTERR